MKIILLVTTLLILVIVSVTYAQQDPFQEITNLAMGNGKFEENPTFGGGWADRKQIYDGKFGAMMGAFVTKSGTMTTQLTKSVILMLINPANMRFVIVTKEEGLEFRNYEVYLLKSGSMPTQGKVRYDTSKYITSFYAKSLAWQFLRHWDELDPDLVAEFPGQEF